MKQRRLVPLLLALLLWRALAAPGDGRRSSEESSGVEAVVATPAVLGRNTVPRLYDLHPAVTAPPTVTPAECPGVAGRACQRACQLRLCKALAEFYRITNNVTDPWNEEAGWDLTVSTPCERLVAASLRRAVYCRWYGVRCCTPEDVAAGKCSVVNAISALEVPINNVNGSIADPGLLPALKTLHDCGMTALNLASNNLGGAFTDAWGEALHHLTVFSISDCWLEGTVPDSLQTMANLTYFALSTNFLNGSLPSWLDKLEHLRVIRLGSQAGGNEGTSNLGFTGTIPKQIGRLHHLRVLSLEGNSLTGPLPAVCGSSGDNSALLLLNVRANQLEGGVLALENCGSLVQLDISHNQFSGSLPASAQWNELATYRVNDNRFTGTFPPLLPAVAALLEYLDVSNNQLSGILPAQLALLSSLKTFMVAGNHLRGTVNQNLFFLPALMRVDLSSNELVGELPQSIGLCFSLAELDVSNNANLTGMLPPQMGMLTSLRLVRTTSTTMSCAGIIKPYMITTNNSCMDPERCTTPRTYGDAETANQRCPAEQQLPCFLRFSDYLVPRDDDSNMRCRVIMRLPTGEAQRRCASTGAQGLGEQAAQLPNVSLTGNGAQTWLVDPSYYQYQACECLLGYKQQWNDAHTVLRCVPDDSPRSQTAVIVGVAAAAAVLVAGLLVFRQYLATRPRWLRERVMQSKRAKGAPRAAKPGDVVRVSIVVTDVQDYAELTRRNPELMAKAMGGHNNILRKACHSHAGYVLDQEGDSWTVAFHDAEDAVAFSLQVQQALSHKVWGAPTPLAPRSLRGLAETASNDESSIFEPGTPDVGGASTAQLSAQSFQGAEAVGLRDAFFTRLNSSFSSGHSATNRSSLAAQRSREQSFTARCSSQDDASTQVLALPPGSPVLPAAWAPAVPGDRPPPRRQVSFTAGGKPEEVRTKQLTSPSFGSAGGDSTSLALDHCSAGGSAASRPLSTGSGNSRLWSAGAALVRRFSRAGGHTVLAAGESVSTQPTVRDEVAPHSLELAVRIGVATGSIGHGQDIHACSAVERAKNLISEMARGGQVLLDKATFKRVKDSLSMLGTVDATGYQDKALQQLLQAQAASQLQRRMACDCLSPSWASFTGQVEREPQDYDADAIVVHMGDFRPADAPQDTLACKDDAASQPSTPSVASTGGTGEGEADTDADVDAEAGELKRNASATLPAAAAAAQAAAPADPAASVRAGGRKGDRRAKLQLYAIAAPGMRKQPGDTRDLHHSTAWCQTLEALQGWTQTQKSYFEAPGARAIDLCLSPGGPDTLSRPALPEVTVVFAQLAGGQTFAARHSRREKHALAKAIRRCMMQLMSVVPGGDGYLCHCYEPEFKYLIAFEAPYRAAQWALLLQEALMYVTWPAYVLAHPGWQEVLDPTTGRPLFRGPRLRIGLAEGQPTSVVPDHWGRANYQGSAIIKAARFMDAAAHGGQVVTDVDTARKLARLWSAQDSLDEANTVSCGASLNAGSISARLPSSVALPDDSAALQAQQDPGSQPASPPDLPGSQQPQLQGAHAQPASSAGPSFSLQPLVSGSSAAASSGHLSGGGMQCAWSTWGLGPTGNEGAVLEPVKAACIGAFTFKGSGTFQMVQLAHASLAARTFPDEPPRGKGFRVSMPEGALALEGFECVSLAIPARLLAARRAFKAIKQLGMEEGS